MTTTTQIRALRTEALAHGEGKQVVICDLALETAHKDCCGGGAVGSDECRAALSDIYTGTRLSREDWREVQTMTSEEAWAECERVIADAAAQHD